MEEKIADENGHVDMPGFEATYPPGTKVYFLSGQYAGHESPVEEEKSVKTAKKEVVSKE